MPLFSALLPTGDDITRGPTPPLSLFIPAFPPAAALGRSEKPATWTDFTTSRSLSWCPPMYVSALTFHASFSSLFRYFTTEYPFVDGCTQWSLVSTSLFDLGLILQKSHMQETFCRTFNDRKRKFVDTELAQDTEGKQMSMRSIHPDLSKTHHLTQARTSQPVYSQINLCVPQISFKISASYKRFGLQKVRQRL